MLEECINIFIYLQLAKRKQRGGEFPGRAQHFFGCIAVKPSLLTRQCFFPGCFFPLIFAEAQPPPSPLTKICGYIGKINEFGLESLSRH